MPGGNGPWAPPLRLLYHGIEYTGLFLWTRDPNPRHGDPDRPPFDAVLGFAALIGVALALRSARSGDAGDRLLLLLAGTSLLAGILGNPGGAPNGLRIYPFVGIALLWAAATVDRWVPFVAGALRARESLLFGLALAALFVVESLPFLQVQDDRGSSGTSARRRRGGRGRSLGPRQRASTRALAWPILRDARGVRSSDPVTRIPKTPKECSRHRALTFWDVTTRTRSEVGKQRSCSRGVSSPKTSGTVISRVIEGFAAAAA